MPLQSGLFVTVVAVAIMALIRSNPVLFGRPLTINHESPVTQNLFTRHRPNNVLDNVLQKYRSFLGEDYDSYYNHCLRVLNFAIYFYDQEAKAGSALEWNTSKRKRHIDLMGFALAYHDIALWTDEKLNYLEPSLAVMERDLKEDHNIHREIFHDPPLTDEEKLVLGEMILQHHKIFSYSVPPIGPSQSIGKDGELLINAVRKGDWVDATMGLIKHGISTDLLEAAYVEIPEAGFHNMLAGMGGRLSPDSFVGQFDSLKIFKM